MAAERRAVQAEGMNHAGSDNARRSDPLLDLLARMVRTAHERERTERRAVRARGRFVEVVPTPYAVARGLPALLPDRIHGGAGEPGRTRARRLNHALIVVPVRGRRELLRAMRRRA